MRQFPTRDQMAQKLTTLGHRTAFNSEQCLCILNKILIISNGYANIFTFLFVKKCLLHFSALICYSYL